MAFNIRLMTNTSADNVAEKEYNTLDTVSGTLKDGTSIINPTIRFAYSGALQDFNYFYIPQFQRWYFVTDIRSVRNGIWDVSGHTDVLTTAWKLGGLKGTMGITRKSQKNWNLDINDGSIKVYQNPIVTTELFPSGFNTFNYVLAVAGGRSTSSS